MEKIKHALFTRKISRDILESKEKILDFALKETALMYSIFSPIRNDKNFGSAFRDFYPLNENPSLTSRKNLR